MPSVVPDLLTRDATAQLHALESKAVGAFELLEACQTALNSRNARFNAIVAADFERAQERARAIDDRRARGETLGQLAGLPVTVKDSFDVEGLAASAGQEALRHRRAVDAHCVARVRKQDAVIWGKTNVPALDRTWSTQGGVYGTTNNPWDLSRTAGGSSGGSAAAVAAYLSSIDIGSDSAGGLRLPAGFCGVYAHRPTPGLVDSRGHVPPGPGAAAERELRAPGPVARSARDLRLLLSVMAEAPLRPTAPPVELHNLKVGLWLDEPTFALGGDVRSVIERFADQLTASGAQVRSVRAPVEPRGLLDLFAELTFMAEGEDIPMAQFARERLLRGPAHVAKALSRDPWAWGGRFLGHTASHRAWLAADEARARLRLMATEAFAASSILLAPCAPVSAFEHGEPGRPLHCADGRRIPYSALGHWHALATVCGLPVTVIPIGVTPAGLPVGVQIIGPRGADSRTLSTAQSMEEAFGGFVAPPRSSDI